MTSNHTAHGRDVRSLGRLRRMRRLADAGGFFLVAAIDHPENYLALFDADVSRVPHETVVASKLELAAAMARHASALLLDPVWSLGQAVLTGDLPGSTGLIAPIERLGYAPGSRVGWDLDVRPRPGWGPAKIAAVGADAAKFLVFHRAELREAAAAQRALVSELAAACHAHGLPLIVEPLWYPLDGEDPADDRVRRARADAIVASAAAFAEAGADILKMQFPGGVATAAERASAEAAARDLDASLRVPWVLLSEGAGYDDFAVQMEICARAGASGYIAGRAVWGDAVGPLPDAERRAAVARAARRLAALNDVVRAHGRPWDERVSAADAAAALPPGWYADTAPAPGPDPAPESASAAAPASGSDPAPASGPDNATEPAPASGPDPAAEPATESGPESASAAAPASGPDPAPDPAPDNATEPAPAPGPDPAPVTAPASGPDPATESGPAAASPSADSGAAGQYG